MDADSLVPRHRFTELNHLSLSFQLGSFYSELLGWGLLEPRWWRNYLHVHSFFEVCYAFHGKGIFRLLEKEWPVQAGDIFVAWPRMPHEIISSREEPLGIYFWSYTLFQSGDEAKSIDSIDALFQAFLTSKQAVSTKTVAMQRTLDLLAEEVVRRQPGYLQSIKGLVTKLLVDTARAVVDVQALEVPTVPTMKRPDELAVQVMLRYLQDNYNRPLSICDLAAQVHVSERHASRLFHNVIGISIKEYLTSLRMEIASQLLLDQHTPIKEVALASGYPDVRYFSTLFRQRVGLTPALFREKGGTRFLEQDAHEV